MDQLSFAMLAHLRLYNVAFSIGQRKRLFLGSVVVVLIYHVIKAIRFSTVGDSL